MNTKPAIIISGSGRISLFIEGKSLSVETDHVNYDKIMQAIQGEQWSAILPLADVSTTVKQFISSSNRVKIEDGAVVFDGEVLHNTLTSRILSHIKNNLPFNPLVRFMENLMDNPSKRAVDELYGFLEFGDLPITEDGCFLAYKKVAPDFKDIHSGTFNNSVGSVCEMQRNRVDEDKDRTCSYGLHFCSKDYLPHFGGSVDSGYHIMVVKINPKDVVAIPADYNNTKGRTCRYEVVGELDKEEYLKSSSVYRDAEEISYDDEDYDDDEDYSDDEELLTNSDEEAYEDGKLDGFEEGFVEGYKEGYKDGFEDGEEETINRVLDSIVKEDEVESGDCCGDKGCCAKTGQTNFYNKRDSKGRFVKASK